MKTSREHIITLHDVGVVDGDTITAWAEVAPEVRILWRIRLKGIEGGELPSEQGAHAKALVAQELAVHFLETLQFVGLPTVRDLHGRHVGDVRFLDGTLLTRRLMESGAYWRRSRNRAENPVTESQDNE